MHPTPVTRPRRRVLHALFSPRMAGSERYCVDLANQQATQGFEVHVVGTPASPLARALSSAVHFHGLHFPLLRSMRLRHLVGRIAPEICHGHLSPACKALARVAAQTSTVATLHVGYKPHQHDRLHGLICVNQAQLSSLQGFAGQKRLIPNWLPSVSAAPQSRRAQLRAELGLADGQLLIGAVGRLHASKGMDVLIDAFRAHAPADARLVVLGEGPQQGALRQLIADDQRIRLLGFQDDVRGHLAAFDLFVSPSREESFGLAILEAMAAGLPILATATDGPRELLRGSLADLVPPGSVPALGQALVRACAAHSAGTLARPHYALQAFDQARGVAQVGDFYTQVLQQRQRRAAAPDMRPARAGHA